MAASAERINQAEYTRWVVVRGRIESGWEFDADAKEHIRKNLGTVCQRGEAGVVGRRGLAALGLDPDDNACWLQGTWWAEPAPEPKAMPTTKESQRRCEIRRAVARAIECYHARGGIQDVVEPESQSEINYMESVMADVFRTLRQA